MTDGREGFLFFKHQRYPRNQRLKILLMGLMMLFYDPLPCEAGVFEIDEECEFEAGEVQVALHLGEVGFVEVFDYLWIDDDFFVHDEIRDALADFGFTIDDGELFLLFYGVAVRSEF